VNPVTPTSIGIVGNTVTIEVPIGAAPVGATLMKTGQTTSYRTGDDGDLQEGRDVDFFTLDYTNPFGNTNRFTDELGGQTYANNIVIDWSTYNDATGKVLGWDRSNYINNLVTWNDAIDNALSNSNSVYISGWRLPNVMELYSLAFFGRNASNIQIYQYPSPYNNVLNITSNVFWASTTQGTTGTAFFISTSSGLLSSLSKTNTRRAMYVRTFTVTGTILT
jgi:hypothetical protein